MFTNYNKSPPLFRGKRGKISDTKKKEKVSVELAAYRDRVRLEKEAKGEIEVGKLLEHARLLAAEKRQKQKKK